ncbi:MAG: hypothetical protein KDB53_04375 [Planctomycetes bacterium]|nr:hypothetical protein [Planctomycetota bacterium]
MFRNGDSRSSALDSVGFDLEQLKTQLGDILAESGLDPDSRTFASVHKMLSDDLDWYFENVADDDSLLR